MPRYVHPVKVAIMATGMTQKEFAPRVGVSQQTLGHVLNGQRAAWPALKQRLAEELGRPVDELFPPTPPVLNPFQRGEAPGDAQRPARPGPHDHRPRDR